MTITDALQDSNLFASWFDDPSWDAWKVVLKSTFGIDLTNKELALFQQYTQRNTAPKHVNELWLLVGRRGGKSMIAALIATYLAFFLDWKSVLTPGERGVGMIICPDRRQGRVVMGYITGFIENTPLLKSMVERKTQESIYLKNGITIEIHTASFRTVRGYTCVFTVCDEIAFWRDESSANPDKEILNALRPAMATVPSSLLVSISTPYSRRGALWETWRRYYGQDGPVLVWQAPSKAMNPTLPQSVIDQAFSQDPSAASAEYDAQFRRDVETFVSREAVEATVVPNRYELPPVGGTTYFGFVDPSGGSQDAMTLAIAHAENDTRVLDVVREHRPPFSPQGVVEEFVQLLKTYRVGTVQGDRYGGEWPREQFFKNGVSYKIEPKAKSDLYREMLPFINGGQMELLDHPRLVNQICNLERRTARSGRDSIDHPPGGHDDVVNAVAGALLALRISRPIVMI